MPITLPTTEPWGQKAQTKRTWISLVILLSLLLPGLAQAADRTWLPATGVWDVPGNWSGNLVPTAADNAWIDNGGTAEVNAGVSGTASTVYVGHSGTGSLLVNGGYVSNTTGYIGAIAGSNGTATVSSGTWANSDLLYVGLSGTGSLLVNGGFVSNTVGSVGLVAGSNGTTTVTSGTWANSDLLSVGNFGTGTLLINGGFVSNTNGYIGLFAGSNGTATVTSGTWANSLALSVGNSGTGSLLVNGGYVSNTNGTIGQNADSNGTATVTGGTWANSESLAVGNSGTGSLIVDGGSVSNTYGYIGRSLGGHGTATVTSGTWANSESLSVGLSGTGSLWVNGGFVSNTNGNIGYFAAALGTATVTSGTWANSGDLNVGRSGAGSLLIDGGLVSVSGTTHVGVNAPGTGAIVLSGSSGNRGTLSTAQLLEGDGAGTVTFDGGILKARADQNDFISGFEAGDVTIDAGGAFIDSNGFDIGIGTQLSGTGGLTKLGAGRLTLTGSNSYAGSTTISDGTLQVGNGGISGKLGAGNIINQSLLILNRSDALALNQIISGTGSVTQTGGGTSTLGGNNSYSGGTTLENGALLIGHNNALGTGTLTIENSTTLFSGTARRITNAMVVNGDFNVFPGGTQPTISAFELDGNMDLTGGNRVITNTMNFNALEFGQANFGGVISNGGLTFASNLALPQPNAVFFRLDGTQANTYTGDTIVGQAVSLALDKSANVTAIAGDVTVQQEAVLVIFADQQIAATSNLVLEGNGRLQVGNGSDITESIASLNDDGSGLGIVILDDDTIGSTLELGSGSFSGQIEGGVAGGTSLVKSGTGTLNLSGSNSYLGDTDVEGGTLVVNGSHSGTGTTTVDAGATLGGSGTLSGPVVVNDNGHLAPGTSPGTLSTGDLTLNSLSQLDFELDTPNVVGGGVNDLISVTGDLILDGVLNITNLGNFGTGAYRLFDYSGSLTDNGLLFGVVPTPFELTIDSGTANQINLNVVAATAQYWDGANTMSNGVIDGGSGTWDNSTTNWTNSAGNANGPWADLTAIFSGSTGTVTVDEAIAIAGLQFSTDDYLLSGTGSLVVSDANTAIEVDPGLSAHIATTISGTGGILKNGSGTLILSGSNTYTGSSTLADGVVRIGSDANLGAGGDLIFQGGILRTTDTFTMNRDAVVNAAGGTFQVETGTTLSIEGDITGTGLLSKQQDGDLILLGDASHSGGTLIDDGSLHIGNGGTTGSLVGDVTNNGFLIFNRSDAVTYADAITGTGGLGKLGTGRLDLTGSNSGSLGTYIDAGILGVTGTISHSGANLVVANGAGTDGTLEISGTGSVSSGLGFVGFGENSTGLAQVTGGTWTNAMSLAIGAFGEGTLEISGTGSVSSDGGILGSDEDAKGTVRVSAGSWTNTNVLGIGEHGTGILEISGSGLVSNTLGFVGSFDTASGTATLSGGTWANSVGLVIGNEGQGTVNLIEGTLNAPEIVIASEVGSIGTLNIGTGTTTGILNTNRIQGGDGTATVNFNHTGLFNFSSLLTGALQVNKLGSGTTVIGGANTFTGGTTVDAGTLRTTSMTALGSGPVALNDGTLDPVGTLNTGTFDWNGGTIASDLGTMTDFIDVNGNLTLAGPGTFDFAAVAGFSNNTAYQIFNADNMAGFDPLTDFVGNALFTLAPEFSVVGDDLFVTFAGTPIFAGTLLQNSAPVGVPTFADFVITGPATTGTPAENNTIKSLTFNPDTSLFVFNTLTVTSGRFTVDGGSGTLSGGRVVTPGDFSKDGSGRLIANSDVIVGGAAKVNAGALYVNGSFTTGGGLTVFQNALLGGSGVIHGDLTNNGTVNPGNSPGTLTINGNYSQTSSGTLQIEIASASLFDRLVVSGNAALAGTLQALNYGGNKLKYGQQFAFLQAGSITGDFDRILMPDPDRFRGRFLAEGGTGTLLVAPTSYTLVAETTNQRNVAKALDSYIPERGNDRETVSIALDLQSEEQYPAAFDAIAPTFYESLADITIDQAVAQNQMLAQRMSAVRLGARGFSAVGIESPLRYDRDGKSVMEPKSAILNPESSIPNPKWSTWVQGNGIFAKMVSASQVPNYHFQSGGFLVGADYRWSENFSTGLYTGYEYTWADYDGGGNTQINSALFGGYASYDNEGFYADAIIGGGYNGYRVRRPIKFSTVDRTARSTPNGGQFSSYLDFGYDWKVNGFTFGPLVSAQYTYAGIAPFTEDGADSLDLRVDQQNANSIRTNLGARIAYTWNVNENITIIPELRGFWQHEFLENPRNIGASLDGGNGPSFGYETTTPDRDSIFAGAGVSAQFGESWSASFYYNANFASQDYLSHAISASLEWKF